MDFLIQLPLLKTLQEQIYICGTIWSNHQGIPREIGPSVQRMKHLRQGESLFFGKEMLLFLFERTKSLCTF